MFTIEFPWPTYGETVDVQNRTREEARVPSMQKTRVKIISLIAKNPEITVSELTEAVGITPNQGDRDA
jgi:hypothetical protein